VAAEDQVSERLVVGDPGAEDAIGQAYAAFVREVIDRTDAPGESDGR
jgi:hypothetical protein